MLAADSDVPEVPVPTEEVPEMVAPSSSTAEVIQPRRVRRARTTYERLRRPDGISPGSPTPSIEGWVLFLQNLPPATIPVDLRDFFAAFKAGEPDYFGRVSDVRIPVNCEARCVGYALVELDTQEGFERAMAEMNNAPITFGLDGSESGPVLLRLSPAFLAEEDEVETQQNEENIPGEKRRRDDDEDAAEGEPAKRALNEETNE